MNAPVAHQVEEALSLRGYRAADLMIRNPISIRAEAGVNEAMALFTDKNITAAPVIDEAGRPIGVVSRSDLLIHQREQDLGMRRTDDYFYAPTFEKADLPDETRTPGPVTAVDLMTPAVFAVSPETPVSQVVKDMVGLHVHRLFVVDEDGILVGVISTMDILKNLRPEA